MPPLHSISTPVGRFVICLFALVSIFACSASAQVVRVVSWNILNYPSTNPTGREPHYRTVLADIQPDIIVVQEVTSTSPGTFLTNVLEVLEPGEWSLVPFVNGFDTDNAAFYKHAVVDFISQNTLGTTLRDINGYEFRGVNALAGNEFRIYSLHLKASQGSTNENRRLDEVTVLRSHLSNLPANMPFLVGGDYNIYQSAEPAWIKLTGSEANNDGRLFDPINRVGTWHNNGAFADIHTQSTRVTSQDGGSTGGMDDRFDFILANDDMLDAVGIDYVSSSYSAHGQDGLHFNQAINSGANNVVSAAVAQALHDASDHLPVIMDITLVSAAPAQMVLTTGPLDFGRAIIGAVLPDLPFSVQNVAAAGANLLDYTMTVSTGFSVPGGAFSLAPGGTDNHMIGRITTNAGTPAANITVTGNDPLQPSGLIPVFGNVLKHARPSTTPTDSIPSGLLFFGPASQGTFVDLPVSAHNYLFAPNQALLNVYDFSIVGADSLRFSLVGFAPQSANSTPATFNVRFSDSGVTPNSLYTAQLILKTRDEQIPGAINLGDLSWTLLASVTTVTDVGTPSVNQTWLYNNYPNPFNPNTRISFDIAQPGRTRLRVFNVRGRMIRTLMEKPLEVGNYSVIWDGTNDQGRIMSSGVYFYQLQAVDLDQTRRMHLVR